VEAVLMDHPAVMDAAVVGSPDQLRGEVSDVIQLLFAPTNAITVADTTTIRLRRIARACFHSTRFDANRDQKMNMSVFRRSHVVVESNANRNFDHFRRSRMRRGIVVS